MSNTNKKMTQCNNIKKQIIKLLKDQDIYKIFMFGSYAVGKVHNDSDIDLLVILNKNGISKNYKTLLENKKTISKPLHELRKLVPIDLLVYTKDEWKILKDSKSSFIKRIETECVSLL